MASVHSSSRHAPRICAPAPRVSARVRCGVSAGASKNKRGGSSGRSADRRGGGGRGGRGRGNALSSGAGTRGRSGARGGGQKDPTADKHVTGAPRVTQTELLQPSATALDPWWSTFCGHSEGVWGGKYCAFHLPTARLEALTLDDDGNKCDELFTHVVEQQDDLDGEAALVRSTFRSVQFHARPPNASGAAEDGDTSALPSNALGLLYFDGGSYSYSEYDIGTAGPAPEEAALRIEDLDDDRVFGDPDAQPASSGDSAQEGATDGSESDASSELEALLADSDLSAEAANWRDVAREEMLLEAISGEKKVSTVEHCIALAGRERVRLQVLLQTSGGHDGELLIDVMRVVLYKETWVGEVGGSSAADSAPSLHKAPRLHMGSVLGTYHKHILTGVPLETEAGEVATKAFFSKEVEEVWARGPAEADEAGVTWWLPHGVSLSIYEEEDPIDGDPETQRTHKTLLRTTWAVGASTSTMETEFTPRGRLREARSCVLVPAENNVPSMGVPAARAARTAAAA